MLADGSERSGFLFRVATLRSSASWCTSRTAPTPRLRFESESGTAERRGQLICRGTSAEFAVSNSGMAGIIGAEADRNWFSMDGAENRLKEADIRFARLS